MPASQLASLGDVKVDVMKSPVVDSCPVFARRGFNADHVPPHEKEEFQ
jgi:hypothetical protein